jgi:adenylyltransferase/sulfurtransferase
MTEAAFERYARQVILPQVGPEGQRRLGASRALVIGAGGLGSPAAAYLAASGVGEIVLNDFDRVEPPNLHRQILYRDADLGSAKAVAGAAALSVLNPQISTIALDGHLEGDELVAQAAAADVILDCTDNLPTRFDINAASLAAGTPLVTGAAIRFEGQLGVFLPADEASPCYRCLYPDEGAPDDSCALVGVFPPVVGMVGCAQALEALKILLGLGADACGRIAFLDGLSLQWRTQRLARNPHCPACAVRAVPPPA